MTERKTPDDVTKEEIWNRLSVILQKQTEIEDRLETIEDNTRPAGGSQPSSHFSRDELTQRKGGDTVLSKFGAKLKEFLDARSNRSPYVVDKHEFENFMADHGWTASTTNTILTWMKKTCNHFGDYEFKVGDNGGRNLPSRIVYDPK